MEVLVQGGPAAVDALRAWLQHGPAAARVDAVQEVAPDEAREIPPGFDVL